MRKCVSGLTLVVVVGLLLVSVATATEEEKQPNALIEELRHDMGEIFETDKYKHAFKVANVGEADLVIENVKPG